jgi:GNAT superfamily N-acetyltransferase
LTPSLTPVGTIRACRPPDKNYYKLTRLAVLKEYRKHRFGAALVRCLHAWVAQDASARLQQYQDLQAQSQSPAAVRATSVDVICHSQIPVKRFYAK